MESDRSKPAGRKYSNEDITVFWKPEACIHASYCYRELIEVFDPGKRPWVDMKGAPTKMIIETVNMCPTEALTWRWNEEDKNRAVGPEQSNHVKFRRPELMDTNPAVNPKNPVNVKIMTDGPIVIKGSFTFISAEGRRDVSEGIISICRCGESDHKPYCDGRHRKTGFSG